MPKVSAERVFAYSFASIHALYVAKAERKGRTAAEVGEVIRWQTGYTEAGLQKQIAAGVDLKTFFAEAPGMNPARALITGVVCGVRLEEIDDPLMREIRYMDKLVDELAKGRAMGRILREGWVGRGLAACGFAAPHLRSGGVSDAARGGFVGADYLGTNGG